MCPSSQAGGWTPRSSHDTLVQSVVINETLARQLFAGEDPIGRIIDTGANDEGSRVVGVVGDIMGGRATRPAPPAFYCSWSADVDRARSALVRTAGDPTDALSSIRQVVEGLDPQLPVLGLVSLAASYLPAYRATRVDPMTGIRTE